PSGMPAARRKETNDGGRGYAVRTRCTRVRALLTPPIQGRGASPPVRLSYPTAWGRVGGVGQAMLPFPAAVGRCSFKRVRAERRLLEGGQHAHLERGLHHDSWRYRNATGRGRAERERSRAAH